MALPSNTFGFTDELARNMQDQQIDLGLTRKILDRYNQGCYEHVETVKVTDIPSVDGTTIIDVTGDLRLELEVEAARRQFKRLGLQIDPLRFGAVSGGVIAFDRPALAEIGVHLYPLLSYGILNGGSASSYFDHKKNEAFNADLYRICRSQFEVLEDLAKEKSKGLAPAYLNQDGSRGASFIELKMRSLLIEILRYQTKVGSSAAALAPLYQMTSVYNDQLLQDAYDEFQDSPYLKPLIAATGVDITRALTGVQPMLAAFSHSEDGRPKTIFTSAYGKSNQVLPMPGGHGQNFQILRTVYETLLAMGKKYIYLGNVDNLGYTVDPVNLALLALKQKQAGFEFSFRTAVDIKGGILVRDQKGRLNCADIGPAIHPQEVLRAESAGKDILFNCATGLFDLEYLLANLDRIIDELPMRFSDQDKDSGRYSQAEQVTWEIIGILDDFLIFGVDKYRRFLAAKLVLENLMASGIALDNPEYPVATDPKHDLKSIAIRLHKGLTYCLEQVYGMQQLNGHWEPKSPDELKKAF